MERTRRAKSVAILLIKDKKILLVHPSGWYNKNAPFYPPKETLEDETIYNCCKRVIYEELGLDISKVSIISYLGIVEQPNKSVHCFVGFYHGNENDIILDWENDRYIWADYEKAMKIVRKEYVTIIDNIKETFKW